MDVLPEPFYTFFVYIEPLATIAGAIYAWCMPEIYYGNLLPANTLWGRLIAKEVPRAGIMAIRQLGNCYLILACMSFFVLPKMVELGKDIRSTTSILQTYFAILAFADITHILATLVDLGPARWQLSSWNMLAHGNTTLVVGLFAFRMWYFAYSSTLTHNPAKSKTT